MMEKMHKIWLLFILTGFLTGCSSSFITTAHVTQPVMLGKIKRIQVNESECEQKQQIELFDIGVISFNTPNQDAAKRADVELLKRIDSPQEELVVDEIRVSSRSLLFLFPPAFLDTSTVGLSGGLYSSKKGDHEKK